MQTSLLPIALPPLKPPLKWAGGKTWLIPRMREIWQAHGHCQLVEPFFGGGAIALALRPDRALLNDANPHLINFYRQVQNGLEVTIDMQNDRAVFDECRRQFNALEDINSPIAAQLFYYLNRTGFNGLCRFNAKGKFNVPFGTYKTINYRQNFHEYVEPMRNWYFQSGDFSRVAIAPDAFIFADPPYDTPFTAYSAGGFNWANQVHCAEWLAAQSVPVVATNQATDRVIGLYRSLGFDIELLDAPRKISCNGNRAAVKEMFATRNL